jgi:hypothetical protein
MSKYINIKEASELTGKHPDTIRRLWKVDGKVDEGLKAKYTTTGKSGEALVDRELLLVAFETPEADTATEKPSPDNQPTPADTTGMQAVVQALTNQLEANTKQLEAKDKQIDQLHKVVLEKESNTTKLQDQFQQLLGIKHLPARTVRPEPQTEEAYAEPMQTEVKEPMHPPKPAKKKQPAKPRKAVKVSTKVNSTAPKQAKKSKPKNPKDTPSKTTPSPATKKRWWSRG